MSDTQTGTDKGTMAPHRQFGLWLLLSLFMLAGVAGLAGLALTGRMVEMPGWVAARVEARLNAGLAPAGVRLGGMDVLVSREGVPLVHFRDVALRDGAGRGIARLPELTARLDPASLVTGRIAVTHVALTGADLTISRAPDGRLDLALGGASAPLGAGASLAELLDQIDRAFDTPGLAAVEAISVEGLELTYQDARAGRTWRVGNGLMTLEQTEAEVAMRAFLSLTGEAEVPSEFAFTFISVKGGPEARFSANFSDVPAGDMASQSPALAALALIDAPISGAIRTEVDALGRLGPLSAALEIGAGELKPDTGAPPIRFDSGKSYFTYDPGARKLAFDQIAVETAAFSLSADGHAYLRDMGAGWPRTLIGQLAFREVALTPRGVFDAPATFSGGALDMKLALDPFSATIGQVLLIDGDSHYRGAGRIRALPEGWDVALDLTLDRIDDRRLVALWPTTLVPQTRNWFSDNVLAGDLYDVDVAVRRAAAGDVRFSLTHAFRNAEVQFLETMPPITGGQGYSTIQGMSYTVAVEAGTITAPGGGTVDVAGSVFRVPDMTAPRAPAEITLRTSSGIGDALTLIDLPPLRIPERAGFATDIAAGRAEVETLLTLPLDGRISAADIDYTVTGRLREVRSDVLVPGRRFAADELRLTARPEEVSITGAATLDGVPVRGAWTMIPGGDGDGDGGGAGRVEGTVELSERTNTAFGLGLPGDMLDGAARGAFTLDLAREGAPRFSMNSDLQGLGLRLPGVAWSKARDTAGTLEVAGTLGRSAAVDRIALSAPGLSVEGSISLAEGGGFATARFPRVRLGDWLTASVVLSGRGAGRSPGIAITGGSADLRRTALPGGGGAGRGSAGVGSVDVALDRLIVSDAIALDELRGRISGQGGLNGQLTGRIAGGAPLVATLVPAQAGTAVRIRSDDAGGVLRGAGVFSRGRGGTLDLTLTPEGPPGRYDGRLRIGDIRVRGNSVLTELLSAVSVVGLVEILEGEGILFNEVESRFRLMPGGVEVRQGSAIGPSLGISMAGLYGSETGRIDMQGVISPVYMLNSVGAVLTRRGEGLFGFNYRLLGDARNPEVRVNPLSILTPGMFREIFRGPPPQVRDRAPEAGQ